MTASRLIFFAGIGQLCLLVASVQVPFHLNWRDELRPLPRLHRQMHSVYGCIHRGVLGREADVADGLRYWNVPHSLVDESYALLTIMFAAFTAIYVWAAIA